MYPRFCAAADTFQAALLGAGALALATPWKADAQRDQAGTGMLWWRTVSSKLAEVGLVQGCEQLSSMPCADAGNCDGEVGLPALCLQ